MKEEIEIKNVNNSHDNQVYKDEYLNIIRKSLETGSVEIVFGRTLIRKGDGRVHVFDNLGEELEIWTM